MSSRTLALVYATCYLLLVGSTLFAQTDNSSSSPLVASGWCVIADNNAHSQANNSQTRLQAHKATPEPPVDPASSTTNSDSAGPGCDAGVGLALLSSPGKRFSWVAAIGTKTVGTGIAWVVYKPTPKFPRAIALAIGIVAPWDSSGIHRKLYPALGATVSFFGQALEAPEQ